METIQQAKDYLRENWEDGVNCPCCKQMVKLYKRKLTTTMMLGLIDLNKHTQQPVHIKEIKVVNGGEFAQMKRWGLIEDDKNDDLTKRTSGQWSITQKGKDFLNGMIRIPKYVFTYNGQTMKYSSELTDAKSALGDKFNYNELMGA